jgi:ferredoxin--NADP+ reductase
MQGWSEGTIVHRHLWAPGLVTLRVAAATDPLVPGQFHNLALAKGEAWIRRSYSVASAPGAPLEFFVTRVEDGDLTPELTDLPVGSRLWVEPRPRGYFTLEVVPPVPELWMWATGTGLGPYLSMLRTPAAVARFQRIVLVHGVRQGAHLAYAEELEALSASRPGWFTRIPVVSREAVPGALHGRVTTLFADGSVERRAGAILSPERAHVLLCGNPAMVEQMAELLGERGLRRHRARSPGHVTYEKYW